jgi:hypothetical protein
VEDFFGRRISKVCLKDTGKVPNSESSSVQRQEIWRVKVFKAEVFLMPCNVAVEYQSPEDGGSMVLRNVGILPQHYVASQAKKPRLESSPS